MPERPPTLLLLDNGSLEPAATLSLRRLAAALSAKLGRAVEPVSLLHSGKVPAASLGGTPASQFEPWLRARAEAGERAFGVIPLFFGPSGAIVDYLPSRVAALQTEFPGLRVQVAPSLVAPGDSGETPVAAILRDQVLATLGTLGLTQAAVIVVDHGSPRREVAAVRDQMAGQLRTALGDRARAVIAASMERRPEPEFAFNEPLLERAFERAGFGENDVVIAMMFLSPGRHAGPGGDVAGICAEAMRRHPGLRVHMTPLVGEHPGLIPLLARRAANLATLA